MRAPVVCFGAVVERRLLEEGAIAGRDTGTEEIDSVAWIARREGGAGPQSFSFSRVDDVTLVVVTAMAACLDFRFYLVLLDLLILCSS
jgi:hypothetical protein